MVGWLVFNRRHAREKYKRHKENEKAPLLLEASSFARAPQPSIYPARTFFARSPVSIEINTGLAQRGPGLSLCKKVPGTHHRAAVKMHVGLAEASPEPDAHEPCDLEGVL